MKRLWLASAFIPVIANRFFRIFHNLQFFCTCKPLHNRAGVLPQRESPRIRKQKKQMRVPGRENRKKHMILSQLPVLL